MRFESILVLFTLMISMSSSALTRTSVADGSFSDPTIWDCTCVPSDTDDIVVTSLVTAAVDRIVLNTTVINGGMLRVNGGTFKTLENLEIQVGGEVKNITRFIVLGDYLFFGTHSGSGELIFNTGGTLYGNGNFLKTGFVIVYSGVYFVDANAVLDFGGSRLKLKTTSSVQNFGDVTVQLIEGTSNNFFVNQTGATLRVGIQIQAAVRLRAHAVDNLVIYQKPGSTTQKIGSTDAGYYNLRTEGTSTASIKTLIDDIFVLNNLTIEESTLDPMSSGNVYDISVGGSWNNASGVFEQRTSTVTFNGLGSLSSHFPSLTFSEVVFAGNSSLNNQLVVLGSLKLSGVLTANGNSIQMAGDWNSVGGSLDSGGGEVIFRGNTISSVTGVTDFNNVRISKSNAQNVIVVGEIRIFGSLYLDFGNLTSLGKVVISSNSDETGRLAEVRFGNFFGDLTVERYMNFAANDWHLIGSSVTGTSVNSWHGDFITTGFPGSDYPSFYFNNITRYVEEVAGHKDEGFVDVSSSAETVAQGMGRRAYIAAGYNKLSVVGPPIIGPFAWDLSYTDHADPNNDGWNLICNPYPSSIDWDDTGSWTRSGVKDAIYVWGGQDGTYTSYVAGIGTNGGTQFIPSSQAFWVQTDAIVPVLGITESAKSFEDETFRTQATQYFKINMITSNGLSDEVAVRAHHEATFGYDRNWDAYEFKSADQTYPSIGLTAVGDVDLSIYSLPNFGETTMIPMPVYTGSTGDVEFTMLGGADFPAKKCSVFDSQENVYYELIEDRHFTIFLEEGDYSDRFFLVLQPLFENEVTDVRSNLGYQSDMNVWLNDEQLNIQNSALDGKVINLTILNTLGQIVFQENAVTLVGVKTIDAIQLNGLMIIQIDDLETGRQYIERLVK